MQRVAQYTLIAILTLCCSPSGALAWDCNLNTFDFFSLWPAKSGPGQKINVISLREIKVCARLKATAEVALRLLGSPNSPDDSGNNWDLADKARNYGGYKYNWETGKPLPSDPIEWAASLPSCFINNKFGDPNQMAPELNPAFGCHYRFAYWNGKKLPKRNSCQFCGPTAPDDNMECACELLPDFLDENTKAKAGEDAFWAAYKKEYAAARRSMMAECSQIESRLENFIEQSNNSISRKRKCN